MVVWITGLAGAGKTEIGRLVYQYLKSKDQTWVFLDGDVFRNVLGRSGYTKNERLEVAKKITKLCAFLEEQNLNVVCCTISLFKEIHQMNRALIKNYFEIFIQVDMDELIRRDKKCLYSNAMKGSIKDVVGVDIDYDFPSEADLIIDNSDLNMLKEKSQLIIDFLEKHIEVHDEQF